MVNRLSNNTPLNKLNETEFNALSVVANGSAVGVPMSIAVETTMTGVVQLDIIDTVETEPAYLQSATSQYLQW